MAAFVLPKRAARLALRQELMASVLDADLLAKPLHGIGCDAGNDAVECGLLSLEGGVRQWGHRLLPCDRHVGATRVAPASCSTHVFAGA